MSTLPEIVIREYDSETGALVSNMSALAFGRVTKGAHSRVNHPAHRTPGMCRPLAESEPAQQALCCEYRQQEEYRDR